MIVPVIGSIRRWHLKHLHGYLMDKVKTGLCSLCAAIFQVIYFYLELFFYK